MRVFFTVGSLTVAHGHKRWMEHGKGDFPCPSPGAHADEKGGGRGAGASLVNI